MDASAILKLLESVGAIRHGHFVLTSGLHSESYVQCAAVLQYPTHAEILGKALAAEFAGLSISCVASPALGGVILGHEVARGLSARSPAHPVRAIFAERDASGVMTLRRGFGVEADEHVLVVEDVWTTGGSTLETMRVIEEAGGRVVGVGAIIDRSAGNIEFEVPSRALLDLKIESFDPDECPFCRAGGIATRPGSRFQRAAS
ncbi:MAG: orotate phosphoribosyltransferase [Candidatus Acidiferrales bacterium]